MSEDSDSIHYLPPSHFILGGAPHCKSLVNLEPCKVTSKDVGERQVVRDQKLEHVLETLE